MNSVKVLLPLPFRQVGHNLLRDVRRGLRVRHVRDFLVVGHPRSGTGYMSKLFEAYGLDVRHESAGKHGISSWMFAVQSDHVPFARDDSLPQDFRFRFRIHVVRNPLDVIASTAFTQLHDPRVVEYMGRFIPIDRGAGVIGVATQTYIGWNRLIESQRPDLTVRVEEAPRLLAEFLLSRGFHVRVGDHPLPAPNWNTRPHRVVTPQEVHDQVPSDLFAELNVMARHYGYQAVSEIFR